MPAAGDETLTYGLRRDLSGRNALRAAPPLQAAAAREMKRAKDVAPASTHGRAPHRVLTGILLNNLIGGGQQRFRDGEAEGFGGLEVDDQFKLGGLDDRQVGRFFAAKNAAGITPHLAGASCDVLAVAHEAAGFGELASS